MSNFLNSSEFRAISKYYSGSEAKRSGIPKIVHIIEGATLLGLWGKSPILQRAFYIHPIAQELGSINMEYADINTTMLALEYALVADNYLCKQETDYITNDEDPALLKKHLGYFTQDVAWMLLADKVQNQSDFRKHHWFKHERSYELERYFNLWIRTLTKYYL